MACRCKHGYRKRNDSALHCRAIEGDMDYCGHQYHCPNTGRWEVNCSTSHNCPYKNKKPVKDLPKVPNLT